jgi:hypothetical protein
MNEEKLKANLAAAGLHNEKMLLADIVAAKLLNKNIILIQFVDDGHILPDGRYYMPVKHAWQADAVTPNLHDIFSLRNPADCLAVVKMLGEKYGISIIRYTGQDGPDCWYWDAGERGGNPRNTYEDAVADAVLEVSGDE